MSIIMLLKLNILLLPDARCHIPLGVQSRALWPSSSWLVAQWQRPQRSSALGSIAAEAVHQEVHILLCHSRPKLSSRLHFRNGDETNLKQPLP